MFDYMYYIAMLCTQNANTFCCYMLTSPASTGYIIIDGRVINDENASRSGTMNERRASATIRAAKRDSAPRIAEYRCHPKLLFLFYFFQEQV